MNKIQPYPLSHILVKDAHTEDDPVGVVRYEFVRNAPVGITIDGTIKHDELDEDLLKHPFWWKAGGSSGKATSFEEAATAVGKSLSAKHDCDISYNTVPIGPHQFNVHEGGVRTGLSGPAARQIDDRCVSIGLAGIPCEGIEDNTTVVVADRQWP